MTRSPSAYEARCWDRSRWPGEPCAISGGSITLTGGTFSAPLAGGSLSALINSGLEGFVHNAAGELPRSLRINPISRSWIRETLESLGVDGADGTPASEART